MSCQHISVFEGICEECHQVIRSEQEKKLEYTKNHPQIDVKGKDSIINSLEGIPVDVKRAAKDRLTRNDAKNSFIQLFIAYVEKGYDFDPHELAKKLGLDRKKVNACIKQISGTSLKDEGGEKIMCFLITSPSVYVPSICEKTGIEEYEERLKEEVEEVVAEKDILLALKPNHVASAIVKNYMESRGFILRNFSQNNGISDTAINKVNNLLKKGYTIPTNVNIRDFNDYNPSTLTMSAKLVNATEKAYIGDTTLNILNIIKFIAVTHLFDSEDKRIKLVAGKRNVIPYYGIDGIIIGSFYKNINRGIRSSSMNNMASLDLQFEERNIHIKLSKSNITCVGAVSYENGRNALETVIEHFNMLKENVDYCKSLDLDEVKRNVDWLYNNCFSIDEDGKKKLLRRKDFIKKIETKTKLNNRFLTILSYYLEDPYEGDEYEAYKDKINEFLTGPDLFHGSIESINTSIYNSVFHIELCDKKKDLKIPIHNLAYLFLTKGYHVEFFNAFSEGLSICIPIDEEKDSDKSYKHRLNITDGGSIKIISPTSKEESYDKYRKVMEVVEEFVAGGCVVDI